MPSAAPPADPLAGLAALADQSGEKRFQPLRDEFELFFTTVFRDAKGRKIKLRPFHRKIIKAIQTKSYSLINVFRGGGKSTLITVAYVCWLIGNNHDIRICIACKNESLAKGFLREITKTMRSDEYREIFGDLVPPDRTGHWTDTEKIVTGRSRYAQGLTLLAVGAMGMVAGRRFDFIVIDDCADAKNSGTAIQRGHLSTWVFEELEPTLEPEGSIAAVGTRWHHQDIYHEVRKSWQERFPDDHSFIVIPVMEKRTVKGEEQWKSVWEQRFSTAKMLIWWRNRPLEFSQQMMNNPVDTSLAFLQREWLDQNLVLLEHTSEGDFIDGRPLSEMIIYFGVDPSWSMKASADYAVICVGAKDPATGTVYVIDIVRDHCDPDKLWTMIIYNANARRPGIINMEANAAQSFLTRMLLENTALNINPHKTVGSKTERFINMSNYFTTRHVKLAGQLVDDVLSPIPALDPLFYEWSTYRGEGTVEHDDCLDALDLMLVVAAYGAPPIEMSLVIDEKERAVLVANTCSGCGGEPDNLYRRGNVMLCSNCLQREQAIDPRGVFYQRLRRQLVGR